MMAISVTITRGTRISPYEIVAPLGGIGRIRGRSAAATGALPRMRRFLLPLLALSLVAAAPRDEDPAKIVRRWVAAVLAHQPGAVDQALMEIAAAPVGDFAVVVRELRATLEHDFRAPELRNNVRRRGALLHTDIALLLPETAAAFSGTVPFLPVGPRERRGRTPGTIVQFKDGKYVESNIESGHWPFASWLLGGVTPHPSFDEFVGLWYRAVAATFQHEYQLGSGSYHLARAREVLPRDPIILFYAGAMYEALASPRFQNVAATAPETFRAAATVGTEDKQLRAAQRFLRDGVERGAPLEAQLRLGRVTGRLGNHADAVALLLQTVPPAGDAQFAYFRELLLGTEQGALGQIGAARASFERAATLFPMAQTPLIAMSDVLRRSGDRARALDVLRRLEALPPDATKRTDPWWDYHRSYVTDAEDQLAAVRAWVDLKGAR